MPFLLVSASFCLVEFVLFLVVFFANCVFKIKRNANKERGQQDVEMGSVTNLNYGYNYA